MDDPELQMRADTSCHSRELSPESAGGAKYVKFEELLKQSDVLSLNLPLNVCFIDANYMTTKLIEC